MPSLSGTDAVAALKQMLGKDLHVMGSGELIQILMRHRPDRRAPAGRTRFDGDRGSREGTPVSLTPNIHVDPSGRTSVNRYVTRSGKCVEIPPPLLQRPGQRSLFFTGWHGEVDFVPIAEVKSGKTLLFRPSSLSLRRTQRPRLGAVNVEESWAADKQRAARAHNNDFQNFCLVFDPTFLDTLVRRMDDNEDIFEWILDEPAFRQTVLDHYAEKLYGRLRSEQDQLGLPAAP